MVLVVVLATHEQPASFLFLTARAVWAARRLAEREAKVLKGRKLPVPSNCLALLWVAGMASKGTLLAPFQNREARGPQPGVARFALTPGFDMESRWDSRSLKLYWHP